MAESGENGPPQGPPQPNTTNAYPILHGATPTPYPILAQAAPNPYPVIQPAAQPYTQFARPAWPAAIPATAQVQAHAQQFYNQYGAPGNHAPNLRFPGRDGVGYGVPGPMDGEPESIIDGRPMANEFFNPGPFSRFYPPAPGQIEAGSDSDDGNGGPVQPQPTTRGRGRGRPRGRGRGWKQLLKGTEHEELFQKEKKTRASGRGRGRGKRSKPVDPGHEFRLHQGEATKAHLEQRYEDALAHARRAVQANPEIFAAHNLMSEVLTQMGREKDALAALMNGALATTKDTKVWTMCAERTLDVAGDNRTNEMLDQALWCYSMAIQADKENYHARERKLDLYVELENYNKARLESKNMLKQKPFDVDNIRTYAELCVQTGDVGEILRAKLAYDAAFAHHIAESQTFGDATDQWSHLNVYLELHDRVGNPVEGVAQLKSLARWFLGRQEETFWDKYDLDDREFDSDHDRRGHVGEFQQGKASREREAYGDGLPLEIRVKLGIFRLKMGMDFHDEALKHFDHLLQLVDDIEEYYDIFFLVAENLRTHRLFDAAISFYEPILRVPDVANEELHMGMGESYVSAQRMDEAKESFQSAIAHRKNHIQARVELAKIYEQEGKTDDALALVKEVIQLGRKDLVMKTNLPLPPQKTKPTLKRKPAARRSRYDTASTREGAARDRDSYSGSDGEYEDDAEGQRPRKLARLVPRQGMEDGDEDVDMDAPIRPRQRRKSGPRKPRARREFDDNIIRPIRDQMSGIREDYDVVKELWHHIEDEDADEDVIREWMDHANKMITVFRSMNAFYPRRGNSNKERSREFTGYGRSSATSRVLDEMEIMRKRLQKDAMNPDAGSDHEDETLAALDTIPTDFCDIPFNEWHHIFVDLALLYARFGDQESCYDVIKEGLGKANVFFYDQEFNNITLAAGICIALIFNDGVYLNDIARKYITMGEYRAGMAYQLVGALASLCYGSNYYSAGPPQKFMLRAVKMVDHLNMPPHIRDRYQWSNQADSLEKRVAKFGDKTEENELDAGVLMHYGHQVSTANHSASALPYFFRALALQPESTVVNLSIATMFIQNAMKRQTYNRQYGIAQGLSFMYRYYDIRTGKTQASENDANGDNAANPTASAAHRQEAEYNIARAWHTLGLMHLAVPGYERALALSNDVQRENLRDENRGKEDFACEAAFALQGIFSLTGNYEAARDVTEQYLVM